MPTRIKDKIIEVQEAIQQDPDLGDAIRDQAIRAIYAGIGSPEWMAFMKNFAADGTPELARLTTTHDDGILYVRQARCYLVANAMCLPGTEGGMLNNVDDFLDNTLP